MKNAPLSLYDQGHLTVAAVRLYTHREEKMPTVEDLCGLTGFQAETAQQICNQLVEIGALRVVEGAFGDRYCLEDHIRLEELERSVDEDEMEREIEEFRTKKEDRQKEIERMFRKKEFDQQRNSRMKAIDKKFRGRGGKRPADPFSPE